MARNTFRTFRMFSAATALLATAGFSFNGALADGPGSITSTPLTSETESTESIGQSTEDVRARLNQQNRMQGLEGDNQRRAPRRPERAGSAPVANGDAGPLDRQVQKCALLPPDKAKDCMLAPSPSPLDMLSKLKLIQDPEVGASFHELSEELLEAQKQLALSGGGLSAVSHRPGRAPTKIRGGKTNFVYDPNDLYEVSCDPRNLCVIILGPGEELSEGTFQISDSVRWKVAEGKMSIGGAERTYLSVKAEDPGLEATLFIPTQINSYAIRLRSDGAHMPLVDWQYPEEYRPKAKTAGMTIAPRRAALAKRRSSGHIIDPSKLNFEYTLGEGPPALVPEKAYDDGTFTYVQLAADRESGRPVPAPFVDDAGVEALVNYDYDDETKMYRIEGIYDALSLRLGQDSLYITNNKKRRN